MTDRACASVQAFSSGSDPPNATITLNAMVKAGPLRKDESAIPYRFRLAPELAGHDTASSSSDEQ
jgi:hypothetical protein